MFGFKIPCSVATDSMTSGALFTAAETTRERKREKAYNALLLIVMHPWEVNDSCQQQKSSLSVLYYSALLTSLMPAFSLFLHYMHNTEDMDLILY